MDISQGIANLVLTAGLVIGGAVGLSLGLVTEHGAPGLITAIGATAGAGIGLWIAQAILAPTDES